MSTFDTLTDLPEAVIGNARDGDVLLCMGAGSIGTIPGQLVQMLQKQ